MTGGLRKEDIEDLDILDADELQSDGTTAYINNATVLSTTASTKQIVFSEINLTYDKEERAEPGDIIELTGTSENTADGTYTINQIINATTVSVNETISDSTGGQATFKHPSGASKIGFNPAGLTFLTEHTLQNVLEEVDANLGSSGLTAEQHQALRQLIHFIDGGPANGFASGAYCEITGGLFPTNITWYTSSEKTHKIVEKIINRTSIITPTPISWKVYATDGTTVLASIQDSITYNGPFITHITRNIYTGDLP